MHTYIANLLMWTHLPSYGGHFPHHKFLWKYLWIHKVGVELVIVQVIGSIKGEWCFFIFTFMKPKLQNQLTIHLELVDHSNVYPNIFYHLEFFSFCQTRIQNWKDKKTWCGATIWRSMWILESGSQQGYPSFTFFLLLHLPSLAIWLECSKVVHLYLHVASPLCWPTKSFFGRFLNRFVT